MRPETYQVAYDWFKSNSANMPAHIHSSFLILFQEARIERTSYPIKPTVGLSSADNQVIISYLRQGMKINAIKYFRDKTARSLFEAKREVEKLESQLNLGGVVQRPTHTSSKFNPTKVALKKKKPRLRHRPAPKSKSKK